MANAHTDLQTLADWLPAIEGVGIDYERAANAVQSGGMVDGGRPDSIDDHAVAFARAVDALRRLDVLTDTPDGRYYAAVCFYRYCYLGPGARAMLDGGTEVENADGEVTEILPPDAPTDGLAYHIGLMFADRPVRVGWLRDPQPAIARAEAVAFGAETMRIARAAYEAIEDRAIMGRVDLGRVNVGALRDALSRLAVECRADVAVHDAQRERDRCAQAAPAAVAGRATRASQSPPPPDGDVLIEGRG
jgi:hypothetical protein